MPDDLPAVGGLVRHLGATGRRRSAFAVMLVVTLAGCGVVGRSTGSDRSTDVPAVPAPSARSSPPPELRQKPHRPAVHLGPDGVRSTAIERENDRPGSPSWRITGTPSRGYIRGFADRTYAAQGQRVVLRVDTNAPSFRVAAYRVGWYAGAGARLVWRSAAAAGRHQPPCTLTPGVNLVSCARWHPSLTVRVSTVFVPGDYLLKLVGSGSQQSYVPLTVWDPRSHATYLVKNDVFTWQAWNAFGGYDYYQGRGSCPTPSYPLCSRARIVSFDRPYAGNGAGAFLALEAPLVRFLERRGMDVAYVTDATVAQHPGILRRHRAVLSLGHDECWSWRERTAAVVARAHGTNLAFFGASAMLRHVRTERSGLGPVRRLVDYRDSAADPLDGRGPPRQVTGNTWSDPPASWPEGPFVGEDYNGFLEPGAHAALAVPDSGSWAFRGTHLRDGTRLPGVVASDVDSLEPGLGHPDDVQVLAHSPLPAWRGQAASHVGGVFYSDMTYYTAWESHAGVWDSGTNNWIPALRPGHGEPARAAATVRQVTANVLHLFGTGPAGLTRPSAPTWRRYYPG